MLITFALVMLSLFLIGIIAGMIGEMLEYRGADPRLKKLIIRGVIIAGGIIGGIIGLVAYAATH